MPLPCICSSHTVGLDSKGTFPFILLEILLGLLCIGVIYNLTDWAVRFVAWDGGWKGKWNIRKLDTALGFRSVESCCSVTQSCPTLCDPMDCSMPGFLVFHHLPELAQTHVCWVSDAIQPSHPLSSLSPPAFNLSQHQGFFLMSHLFTSGGQSIGTSVSVLPMNIQDWFPLGSTGLISLQSKL